jgi:hypothetical protein
MATFDLSDVAGALYNLRILRIVDISNQNEVAKVVVKLEKISQR